MSRPNRRTRPEAKAATRAALLRAAADVFRARGFTAASVEEIAEAAGFTRGAFYANFADKADALLTLLDGSRADAMAAAARMIETTPDDEKLAALQSWYSGMAADRLDRALAELSAQADHADEVRARLAQRQADTRAVIATTVRGYLDATGVVLALDDDTLARIVLAIGDGVANQRNVDPTTPADLFTTAVAFVWIGALSGPPASPPPA